MKEAIVFLLLGVCLCACSNRIQPESAAYQSLYAHLQNPIKNARTTWECPDFLIIFVDAPHLDYTDNRSFLETVACHPRDGSTRRDFGHVWIYLQGEIDGQSIRCYGGHSGELGLIQAKYFDGIMNYLDYGYANPTRLQRRSPCYEENPARYLWETQNDGFFEQGSGNHRPSFAAKVNLTKEQLKQILTFIQKYDYSHYALTGNQCSSFAACIASIAGLDLDCEVTMKLDPELWVGGERVRLWIDPQYSSLTIATPDMVERSLMEAVRLGKAQFVPLTP